MSQPSSEYNDYPADEIAGTLERIINYNDLSEEEFKAIRDMAIIMLREWS